MAANPPGAWRRASRCCVSLGPRRTTTRSLGFLASLARRLAQKEGLFRSSPLLSAVLVFVASSLIHMVFKWHNADYKSLPNEDEVREAIRKANPAPGMYVMPYCPDMKDMGSEAMQKKYSEGPIGMLFMKANGSPNIGPALMQWFMFSVAVSIFAAYVASRTLGLTPHYLQVFRIIGTLSFIAYSAGAIPAAIWMGQPWKAALKDMADGLIYALLTAGTFGWLWPH